MNKGLLIVISGPSGAGKGTICKELTAKIDYVELSVSATTRKPRKGEIEGKNYFFLTKEEFKEKIDNEDFLEYASVYENFYGTPKKKVMKKLEEGKNIILEIDIQGALSIKKIYKEGVFIFILPPTLKELKHRIVGRGTENDKSISQRTESAYEELNYAFKYDYVVVNDLVDLAVEKVKSIIIAEKCKVSRQIKLIEKIKES